MKIKAGGLQRGMVIRLEGREWLVLAVRAFALGRGAAKARVKLKNLQTGEVVRRVFATDDELEEVQVETQTKVFLYQQGEQFVFADPQTWEQVMVKANTIAGIKPFLKPGEKYRFLLSGGRILEVTPPKKMALRVVETEVGVRGDTISAANKTAVLEGRIKVKVPLFIQKGEVVIINTETGEYLERGK